MHLASTDHVYLDNDVIRARYAQFINDVLDVWNNASLYRVQGRKYGKGVYLCLESRFIKPWFKVPLCLVGDVFYVCAVLFYKNK